MCRTASRGGRPGAIVSQRMRPRSMRRVVATTNFAAVLPPRIRLGVRGRRREAGEVGRIPMAAFTVVWLSLTATWCVVLIKSAMWFILLL